MATNPHPHPPRTRNGPCTDTLTAESVGTTLRACYSPGFHDTDVAFDTTRKARVVAEALRSLGGWELVAPDPVDDGDLELVHSHDYVEAVQTGTPEELAASNGIGWDERLFGAVAHSTGGIVTAALMALADGGVAASLSSGLHHAGPSRGRGFCTFNGLALAAVIARRAGAHRVLIVDLDAHCGGGSAAIFDGVDGVEQVDVSTNRFDQYAPRVDARLEVAGSDEYLSVVERTLADVADPEAIDLVLYNAGVDVHERAGGDDGFTTELLAARERLVFDWTAAHGRPVAFTLAGGYVGHGLDLEGVADLHLETFRAAAVTAG